MFARSDEAFAWRGSAFRRPGFAKFSFHKQRFSVEPCGNHSARADFLATGDSKLTAAAIVEGNIGTGDTVRNRTRALGVGGPKQKIRLRLRDVCSPNLDRFSRDIEAEHRKERRDKLDS